MTPSNGLRLQMQMIIIFVWISILMGKAGSSAQICDIHLLLRGLLAFWKCIAKILYIRFAVGHIKITCIGRGGAGRGGGCFAFFGGSAGLGDSGRGGGAVFDARLEPTQSNENKLIDRFQFLHRIDF